MATLKFRRYADGTSLEGEAPTYHEFSDAYIANAREDGFVTIEDGVFVFHLRQGQELRYRIVSAPTPTQHFYGCALVGAKEEPKDE